MAAAFDAGLYSANNNSNQKAERSMGAWHN